MWCNIKVRTRRIHTRQEKETMINGFMKNTETMKLRVSILPLKLEPSKPILMKSITPERYKYALTKTSSDGEYLHYSYTSKNIIIAGHVRIHGS